MKLVLADASYLKDSIVVIADLVNEARFKITKDGMEVIAMDPANVAMVIFKLLSSSFTEFDLEKDIEIGVNLQSFKQILRRSSPSDTLTIEVSAENKLKIQLRGTSIRTFSLPIIELDEREQRVPNLSFNTSISMHSSALLDAITDADIVAESVTFSCEADKFTIAAQGDHSNASIEIKASDHTRIRTSTTADVKSKYSIEYLKKMISGSKLAEIVDIQFNQDYPLRLDYKVVDRLSLSFVLAPRVEND
jgi:proliferating cell nuclear antigen